MGASGRGETKSRRITTVILVTLLVVPRLWANTHRRVTALMAVSIWQATYGSGPHRGKLKTTARIMSSGVDPGGMKPMFVVVPYAGIFPFLDSAYMAFAHWRSHRAASD